MPRSVLLDEGRRASGFLLHRLALFKARAVLMPRLLRRVKHCAMEEWLRGTAAAFHSREKVADISEPVQFLAVADKADSNSPVPLIFHQERTPALWHSTPCIAR